MAMIASTHSARTRLAVDSGDGIEYLITDYLGAMGTLTPGPQAFMSETDSADAILRPHFHTVDQFQIFWRGGCIGKRRIEPLLIHYTDAYKVYGPITAAINGLKFLTVRVNADPGPRYMPGARAERRGHHRGRHFEVSVPLPRRSARVDVDTVIGCHDDGLAAHRIWVPAGEALPRFTPAAGVHYLVLDGAVHINGREHQPLSILYVDGRDEAGAVAGSKGLAALALQFPVSLTEHVPVSIQAQERLDVFQGAAEFRAALARFNKRTALLCEQHGLTAEQYVVLLMVKGSANGSESLTVTDLARQLELAHNGVAERVGRLERDGLVLRETSETDRRVTEIRLTARGNELLTNAFWTVGEESRHLAEVTARTSAAAFGGSD